MPCMDPPRRDTALIISEAQGLGLYVKMLTEYARGIARETCRQIGLGKNVYNADQLVAFGKGDMSSVEIYDLVEIADGDAEVFYGHK